MPLLTTEERLGKTFGGKYRLDRVLGEGGMGVVYAGHHLKLDLPVAVKFLHPQYSRTQEIIDRFLREAKATSRLVHPNVVGVRDVDVAEDGSAYMVLEYLQGRSLATHLEHEKVLSVDETLSIVLPVCDALAAAHDLGITHRDIKPDNVFLSRGPDGRVTPKVLDFGIAKLTEQGSGPSTATGAVMGTALYMAPEQAMGRTKEVGPVSDVWSTAVMTYECLTGTFPFNIHFGPEMNAMAVMMATITATIVPLSDKRDELGAMSGVLARALDRDPTTRTASMRAFADDLRSAVAGVNAEARRSRMLSPPSDARVTTGPMGEPSSGRAGRPARTDEKDEEADLGRSPAAPTSPARPIGPYLAGGTLLMVLAIGGASVAGLGGETPVDPATTAVVEPPSTSAEPPRAEPTRVEISPAVTPGASPETPTEEPPGPSAEASAEASAAEASAAESSAAEASAAGSSAAEARAAEARAAEARAAESRAAETRAAEARAAEAESRAAESSAAEARAAESRAAESRAAAEANTATDHRAGGLNAGEF